MRSLPINSIDRKENGNERTNGGAREACQVHSGDNGARQTDGPALV